MWRPALRLGRIPTPSTVSLTLYLHHSLALFSRSYYVHDLSFLSFFFVPQVFILCTIFMIYLFLSLLCSPGDHTMYYLHDLSSWSIFSSLSSLFSRCSYYDLSSWSISLLSPLSAIYSWVLVQCFHVVFYSTYIFTETGADPLTVNFQWNL